MLHLGGPGLRLSPENSFANGEKASMDFLNNIVGQLGGTDKIASLAKTHQRR